MYEYPVPSGQGYFHRRVWTPKTNPLVCDLVKLGLKINPPLTPFDRQLITLVELSLAHCKYQSARKCSRRVYENLSRPLLDILEREKGPLENNSVPSWLIPSR